MKSLSLRNKLILAFLVVGVIPFLVIGVTSLMKSKSALNEKAFGQLESSRETKRIQIERFFDERRGDMKVMIENVGHIQDEAFRKIDSIQELKKSQLEQFFTKVTNDIGLLSESEDVRAAYQQLKAYHDSMGFGESDAYDVKTPEYNQIWAKFENSLGNYVKKFNYYDVFVICKPHGHVMYTYAKESDMGANLSSGKYREEGLSKIWEKALAEKRIVFEDYSAYTPSNGDQAMFTGAPVYDDNGQIIAVVALQISEDAINTIVQQRKGLSKHGETYLAATDGSRIEFRSDLTTMGNGAYTIGYDITSIAPEYLKQVLGGQAVNDTYTDTAGNPVIVGGDRVEISDTLSWAMITKENLEDALLGETEEGEKDYFTKYIESYGYYDLFLLNKKGYVFYTVTKEADYQTNMVNGKYASSNLGSLVRQVMTEKTIQIVDFAPYAPSGDKAAAFIAGPIVHNGEVETVVAMQLSLAAINAIMQERTGMGETGETYLVGPDKRMRSDSYLDPEGHSVNASFAGTVQNNGVETKASDASISGKTGAEIITDYNGNSVLSAYAPLKVSDTISWGIIAEIDESEAFAAINAIEWILLVVGILGIAAIITVAWFVALSITRPVNRISDSLRDGSGQVASAAGQVSTSSQTLAEGASEQAASIEETSSSLEEMGSQTKQNADNANQADTLMKDTAVVVGEANDAMGKLSHSMEDISAASEETSKIIKTIDEIAFQTNLLALNAAVEAARAGEAGAGFAVVADEVRNLAMRAADAAKNTSELIEGTVKKIKEGADITDMTNTAFSKVSEANKKVAQLISEIAAASGEQSKGIEQINMAVTEMDKVTQTNAANAEESASASEEMNAQAEQMTVLVAELTSLVTGSSEKKNDSGQARTVKKKSDSVQLQSKETPKTARRGSGGQSEKVIPFDDDEHFGDWK